MKYHPVKKRYLPTEGERFRAYIIVKKIKPSRNEKYGHGKQVEYIVRPLKYNRACKFIKDDGAYIFAKDTKNYIRKFYKADFYFVKL